jgi:hypothetical protein
MDKGMENLQRQGNEHGNETGDVKEMCWEVDR